MQGIVEKIYLDRHEPCIPSSECKHNLSYPPALILFRPDKSPITQVGNLPKELIPIKLSTTSIQMKQSDRKTSTIYQQQYTITGRYVFTDYKAQGQTLFPLLIDISNSPGGSLNQFNAYVAISHGHDQKYIHILGDFDYHLFIRHPPYKLVKFDVRLDKMDKEMKRHFL
jgi:hypothetical protein